MNKGIDGFSRKKMLKNIVLAEGIIYINKKTVIWIKFHKYIEG